MLPYCWTNQYFHESEVATMKNTTTTTMNTTMNTTTMKKESEVITMKNTMQEVATMKNVMSLFVNVAESRLESARAAKNPLGTTLGRAFLGTSYAYLQVLATLNTSPEVVEKLAAYVNVCLYLVGREALSADTIRERSLAYGVISSMARGEVKTIGISAWKKLILSGFGGLEYVAPKKEYKALDFDAIKFEAAKPQAAKVLSERMRSMTAAELREQAAKVAARMEKQIAALMQAAEDAETAEKIEAVK